VRRWRAANREKIREQARRYYWANPDKHREQRRERGRIRKAQMIGAAGRREPLSSIISETLNQADARIDASVVPYRIRRQTYRVLRSSSN
jgi:hypothetical protein